MCGVQPVQKLVAQRRDRERNCLRKFVAHKVLHEQLRSYPDRPRATPSESKQLPSHHVNKLWYWSRELNEDTALALVIERLVLGDLEEQERLNSSATERLCQDRGAANTEAE
jgi:hypothetical protein